MTEINIHPILSVSRRTDIPAFAAKSFVKALLEENRWGKPHLIFFWSKNPAPILEFLPAIQEAGIKTIFQYTLNPYPEWIEPGIPGHEERIATFHALQTLADRVVWRYDPIIYNHIKSSRQNREWHANAFKVLAEAIQPKGNVVISFLDDYGKIHNKMQEKKLRAPTPAEARDLMRDFVQIANGKFQICTCAEAGEFPGVKHSACIDPVLIEELCPELGKLSKDPSQRKLCGCAPAYDVGKYHTCKHGCIYCYAS